MRDAPDPAKIELVGEINDALESIETAMRWAAAHPDGSELAEGLGAASEELFDVVDAIAREEYGVGLDEIADGTARVGETVDTIDDPSTEEHDISDSMTDATYPRTLGEVADEVEDGVAYMNRPDDDEEGGRDG